MKRLAWLLGIVALTSVAGFAADDMKMHNDRSMSGWESSRDYSYLTPNEMVNKRHKKLYKLWDAQADPASSEDDIRHARMVYMRTSCPAMYDQMHESPGMRAGANDGM